MLLLLITKMSKNKKKNKKFDITIESLDRLGNGR